MSRLSTIILLRQMSVQKVTNLLLLRGSFYLSRWFGKPLHAGMPMSISVEPTTSCNLRCPECPSGLRAFTRPTGMMQEKLLAGILNRLQKSLVAVNFYFQGEPFLNRKLPEMIREASNRKIFTSTSTNGHYLDAKAAQDIIQAGLHRLIVSVDGSTQDVYAQYRVGGSLEKAIEGIREVVQQKKRLGSKYPEVILQMLVVKPNEHQVEEILELGSKLGVDEVRMKTAQLYDYENGHPLIPDDTRYSRYTKTAEGKWRLKNKLANHCWRMWQGCVFTWDGKVIPCCFDKDASQQLGNFSAEHFSEIWKGAAYRRFRHTVLTGRDQIEICRNCSEGTKVWA